MSKYLISLILLSVISMGVSAQRITRQYNNVSFSAALKDLNARQDKYDINFVYDELEDFKVTKNIKNQSVPDAIMNLIGFYPIKMKQVGNVVSQLAAFYHVKVELDNAESQHIRIFFNWDKTKTLKQNLEILNAFERIQITELDGTLKVE